MDSEIIVYGAIEVPGDLPPEDQKLVERWIRTKRSPGTRAEYTRDFKNFQAFYFSYYKEHLATITAIDLGVLQDYEAYLLNHDRKPNTVGRKLAMLKSLLTFLHNLGITRYNLGAAYKLPQDRETLVERILEPEQVDTILKTAEVMCSPRDCSLIYLLYGAGLRTSEVCGLRWKDVQKTRNGYQITVLGKGSKKRYILIHEKLWEKLQELENKSEYVFPSENHSSKGAKLHRSSVYRIVKKVMVAAGLPAASSHWLRHAHADAALAKYTPLRVLMDTMGHADLRTTTKYQHVRPGDSSSVRLDLW